jgi:FkbM family methyltransferase
MERSRQEIYNSPRQKLAWVQHLAKARFKRPHRKTVQAWLPYIPAHGVVLDVGAHFGYIAKELAALHQGTVEVIAFEPIEYCYTILERIAARRPNIKIEYVALSDSNGQVDISIPVKKSGRLGIGLSHIGAEQDRDYIIEPVAVRKLDDYVAEAGLAGLDFIKADVEGAEGLVLRGGAETIKRFKPAIILEISDAFCQRMNYRAADIFDQLEALGYQAQDYQPGESFRPCQGYNGPNDYLFTCP